MEVSHQHFLAAACALATRMMTNPTRARLACLRRHVAGASRTGSFYATEFLPQLLQEVLANPAQFPLGWVLGAEQATSASIKEQSLARGADIADQQAWFA